MQELRGINFDYDLLAKKLIEQMPGSLTAISLQTVVDEYLAFVERNRSSKTYEGVQFICKKLLTYFSTIRKLDTIKLKDAECFLDSLKQTAPKGVYNYHRSLRAMFNKAKEWNYLRENPFSKIKLQNRQSQKPEFVTEAQLDIIVKHIESEIVRDVVVTAFYSGCRREELVNLTWQDVNFKNELLTIGNKAFETKTRKQRVIPIHPRVKEILISKVKGQKSNAGDSTIKKLPSKNSFVFCKSNGFKFTGDYFSRRFKLACRLAGVEEEIHFHCLRHGAATKMIMNGAPLPSVQKILGHSNIQTTMIYTHPDIEDLRAAVNKL